MDDEGRARVAALIAATTDRCLLLEAERNQSGTIEDFTVVYINQAAADAVRASPGDVTGHRLTEVLPDAVAAGLVEHYVRVAETGEPLRLERLAFDKALDGAVTGVVADIRVVKVGDGCGVVWTDVTEQHKTLEALRAGEERFRATVDALGDGLTILSAVRDADGAIVDFQWEYFNRAAAEAMRRPTDDVVGTRVFADLPNLRASGLFDQLVSVVETGTPAEYEIVSPRWADEARSFAGRAVRLGDGVVSSFRDVTRQRQTEDDLRRLAMYDRLTGLGNRAHLFDHLEQVLRRSERLGIRTAVLFIDVDNFKSVNDTLGHAAGDELLATIGRRLAAASRGTDTPARFGGDEFIIVCEDVHDEHEALRLAQRMSYAVGRPCWFGAETIVPAVSVGVALQPSGPNEPIDADALVRRADLALRHAKQRGKQRCELFDEALQVAAEDRQRLESDLVRAFAAGDLQLLFEPVVELATRRVVAAEAKVRWAHPTRGMLTGDDIRDAAAARNLTVPIGNWTLRRACRQLAMWRAKHTVAMAVCVPVAARQVTDPDFVAVLTSVLAETNTDARDVRLQLAEEELTDPVATALQEIADLVGCRVGLDRFGSGSASLLHIKLWPVATLKIDPRCVRGILEDPGNLAILDASVRLGRAFGLQTIADGVETQAQLDTLRDLGCDFAQGPLFSPPVTPAELGSLLDANP